LPYAGTPFDANMGFRIYLPPRYKENEPDLRFPVVYMLHGYGGNANSFVDGNVPQVADALINSGQIQPMILVFPYSGGTIPVTGSSFYADGPAFGLYQSYITQALMPYINRTFNVDSTRVGISGHSMGGYGAMMLALSQPTLFRSVCAHSGPLNFA